MQTKTLLVLDDDDLFHRILTFANKPNFFHHIYHHFEVEALIDYLSLNKQLAANLPDVIFVDLSIPVNDGWNFLNTYEEIRASLCKEINVYILTASVRKSDRERASGYTFVKQFISKPFTMDQFREIAGFNALRS
ncbi:response regulator [Mucilaginibacter corticis]|uniref:response regulator n=1 Tax=Mucilaginibacter corticis TaxID=2597670 RepID=UPI0016424727|nr:response regulator [Mucilaginibacter corticis]